jgi:GTP-dependent dephospho-CoA kinase
LKLYRLPEELRPRLAKPIGKLYVREEVESNSFAKLVSTMPMVVTVGDRVTETLGGLGRVPDVQVVDSHENRKERKPPEVPFARVIRAESPAGAVSEEAIDALRSAFEGKKPVRVLVEGEEDLLAMPAIVFAPLAATVFYGQPGQGIVLVKVDARSKARSRAMLAKMGLTRLR